MKPVKDIIKDKRLEYNLTMKELAEKVGVSEGTISRWESGEIANMRRGAIMSLSKVLNIPPNVLMGWDKNEDDIISPASQNNQPQLKGKISNLAKRLEELMALKGLRQIDIAEKTGLGKSAISQYVSGKITPKQDKVYILAEGLNVSPTWLMGYDVPMEKEKIPATENPNNGYYTDPEVAELAEKLRTNPNGRILFDASKDLSKKDIEIVLNLIQGLKEKEGKAD